MSFFSHNDRVGTRCIGDRTVAKSWFALQTCLPLKTAIVPTVADTYIRIQLHNIRVTPDSTTYRVYGEDMTFSNVIPTKIVRHSRYTLYVRVHAVGIYNYMEPSAYNYVMHMGYSVSTQVICTYCTRRLIIINNNNNYYYNIAFAGKTVARPYRRKNDSLPPQKFFDVNLFENIMAF